jgi:hypothetical protein
VERTSATQRTSLRFNVDARRCPNTLGVTGGKHVIDTCGREPGLRTVRVYDALRQRVRRRLQSGTVQHRELDHGGRDGLYGRSWYLPDVRSAGDVETIINDYLNLIDAVININMTTGKFELVLARDDYDPDTILELG